MGGREALGDAPHLRERWDRTVTLTKHQQEMFTQRLQEISAEIPGYAEAFTLLESFMVKDHPNTSVVVTPWACPYLIDLLAGGHVMNGKVRKVGGEHSGCHSNIAKRYLAEKIHAIGTGFGLSDDGLWREHSWGLTKTGIIVESTVARTVYYGVVLTGHEAREFCQGVGVTW